MKQKASLSIGGVLLAIVAAIFFGKGNDEPANAAGGGTEQQAQAPDRPAPPAEAPAKATSEQPPAKAPPSKPAQPSPSAPKSTAPKSAPEKSSNPSTGPPKTAPARTEPSKTTPKPSITSSVGFTSRRSWRSHFEKHGHEFGRISAEEYLQRAQRLRDAPLSRDVRELKRRDGVITRFDRRSGDFIAFNRDKTIRTLFRPNDGERYFERQARR